MVSHLTELNCYIRLTSTIILIIGISLLFLQKEVLVFLIGFMSVPELPLVTICKALQDVQEYQSLGDRVRTQRT
jgi:energy-converting hydrogenase Eha subunit E